jgi:hypothetical protein
MGQMILENRFYDPIRDEELLMKMKMMMMMICNYFYYYRSRFKIQCLIVRMLIYDLW